MNLKHLWAAVAGLVITALMNGCMSADEPLSSEARVRLVNATTADFEQLRMLVDGDEEIGAVDSGEASGYEGLDPDTYDISVARVDDGTPLDEQERTLENNDYTLVAYGSSGSLKTVLLTDEEDEPDSGEIRVRVFNGAADAPTVDVYLTDETTDLDDASPVASGVEIDDTSDYVTRDRGTYRLRVTTTDDEDEVLLDLSDVELDGRDVATIIITGTPGGFLVNAVLVKQGEEVTSLTNTQTRLRLVAAVADNGTVTAGTSADPDLFGNAVASPQIGGYRLIGAGSLLSVSVNGSSLTCGLPAQAGADRTLLVYGTNTNPLCRVIEDDNSLPATESDVRIRLVHAEPGLTDDSMNLSVDDELVASNVAYGDASAYASRAAGEDLLILATSPGASAAIFQRDDKSLEAKAVYTVFAIGYPRTDTQPTNQGLTLDR